MTDTTNKPTKPNDPPYGGGEDERPQGEERPERSREVKEPPQPGKSGSKDRFPRKDEV